MVKVKIKRQVPAGTYRSDFLGAEETQHAEYGEGLNWLFEITAGPWRGERVSRRTGSPATSKNATGKFLTAMTGQPVEKLDGADLEEYVGTRCLIVVTVNDSGWPRVESFVVEQPPDAAAGTAPTDAPF